MKAWWFAEGSNKVALNVYTGVKLFAVPFSYIADFINL